MTMTISFLVLFFQWHMGHQEPDAPHVTRKNDHGLFVERPDMETQDFSGYKNGVVHIFMGP